MYDEDEEGNTGGATLLRRLRLLIELAEGARGVMPLDGRALEDCHQAERRLAAALALGRDAADAERNARRAALRLSASMGRRGGRRPSPLLALLHTALDPLRLAA